MTKTLKCIKLTPEEKLLLFLSVFLTMHWLWDGELNKSIKKSFIFTLFPEDVVCLAASSSAWWQTGSLFNEAQFPQTVDARPARWFWWLMCQVSSQNHIQV